MNDKQTTIPKLIYITGIDGSGKSTVSDYLAQVLREKGYNVNVLWLRYNHVFSKPLLGLCRLLGYTKYETHNDIRVGYHNFQKSPLISALFLFFQYLDALRVKHTKILPNLKKNNQILILDRYVYDILIDIAVDTGNRSLFNSWLGNKLLKLLPQESVTILIRRDLKEILDVRPEGNYDRNFEHRYNLYQSLTHDTEINIIENDGSLENLQSSVKQILGISQ